MKVAVIGAGASGLTAIKCCLDEGLEPVCFEKDSDVGGLWRYSATEKDHACVYDSCVMITSKEMSCFSDFPMPRDYPLFLPHALAFKYLSSYAENFNLRPYIRFNTKIQKITHTREFNMNDTWKVTYKASKGENEDENEAESDDFITETFDAVMVCSGHHWKPKIPKLPGADSFAGEILHSVYYRDGKNYHGKNVLVVGLGDSGAAIACELSQTGGRVYLSTRRGAWVASRLQSHGTAVDQMIQRRFWFDLPRWIVDWCCMKLLNQQFDHADFGLLPEHTFMEQRAVVNDSLPYKILSGAVVVKPDLTRFVDKDAHFEDGSIAKDLDLVIVATGYQYDYSFLEEGAIQAKAGSPVLYKHMFRTEENPTLAFIGSLQPVGCMFPVAELQARVATRVFKGTLKLPNVDEMKRNIKEREKRISEEYCKPAESATNVFLIPYCNELAELLGCKPRLGELLMTDPWLAYRCYLGPCSPSQYRLKGPGAWGGARKAIMELPERNVHKMKKREKSGTRSGAGLGSTLFLVALSCILAAWLYCWYN